MTKRLWAFLLALAMVITMVPANGLLAAAEELPPVYLAAYAASVTVDGIQETAWLLNESVTGQEGAPSGSFGALWNANTLYLAVKSENAGAMEFSINSKTLSVTLGGELTLGGDLASAVTAKAGTILEISIPLSALDFTLLDYSQTMPITVTLSKDSTASYSGTLGFMGISRTKTGMQLGNFSSGKAVLTPSNNGYEDVPGGIHIYDRFGETNGNGRLYFFQTNIYPSNTVTRWVEFDFYAKSMPVEAVPKAVDNGISNFGFYFYMSTGNLTGTPVGIVNTAEGLYFAAGAKLSSFQTIPMGKKVGDTFHVALGWTPDDILHLYVDGNRIASFENTVVTTPSAFGNSCLYFALWRRNSVATSSADDYDITLTNICAGTGGSVSILDALPEETILGSNPSASAVSSNLILPGALNNGQIGPVELEWTSSNEAVVSTDGSVHRGVNNEAVTVTATIKGTQLSKSFHLTVLKQVLEAGLRGSALTMDNDPAEANWYSRIPFTFTAGTNAPTGEISVLWDKDNLYFGLEHENASGLKLLINGKEFSYTDIPSTGLEAAIAFTELGIHPQDYNKVLCSIEATLVGSEGTNALASAPIDLVLTGQLVKDIGLSDKTVTNASTTLQQHYKNGYFINHDYDMTLSQTLCFTDLPVCDGTITTDGRSKDRYSYYIYDNMDSNGTIDATYQTLMVTVYRADTAGNLYLRVSNGKKDNSSPVAIALNRKLGDTFRLDTLWGADNSATVFVDGVPVGHFENVTYRWALSAKIGSYIDMCYQGSAADKTASYSISDVALMVTAYESIRNEITPAAVFGSTDLGNITADLPLPDTFESPYLGQVPLTWVISDETVIAPDGTVTRPEKLNTDVELKLIAFENTHLWNTRVTVSATDPYSAATVSQIATAFTSESITLDGSIKENGWAMGNKILSGNTAIGKFGVQWDASNLYLAVDTQGNTLGSIVINGKTIGLSSSNSTSSGDITEIKLALADLGITVTDYGVNIPASISLGDGKWEGSFKLTSIDWASTDNEAHRIGATAGVAQFTDPDPKYIGYTQTPEGWNLYNLYNFDGENPSAGRIYTIPNIGAFRDEALANRSNSTFIEFDLRIDSMPQLTIPEATGWNSITACYGLSWYVCDRRDDNGFANIICLGVFNTEDGLSMAVMTTNATEVFPLNRQVGQTVRIGTAWTPEGNLILFIDGEKLAVVEHAERNFSAVGDRLMSISLYRKGQAQTRSDSIDIHIDNLAIGNYLGESIADSLTFDVIKGSNTDRYDITSNLVLPASFTNGQLTASGLTWESSDPDVISNTGVVTKPVSGGKTVTMTAKFSNGTVAAAIDVYVKGQHPGGNVLVCPDDRGTATGQGVSVDAYAFTLDTNNNSVIYDMGQSAPVNVVALTDSDEFARLNEDVLTLWVSDDNITYTEIESFKLLHSGKVWYLYDFMTTARYVKVHCTHYDGKEADFIASPAASMIRAYYESVFGGSDAVFTTASTYTAVNSTDTAKLDCAWTVSKADLGIPADAPDSGIRIYMDSELLYHYVDGAYVIVRIPTVEAGQRVSITAKYTEDAVLDISNKEYVYEVSYGTRENFFSADTYFVETLPDGTVIGISNDAAGQLYRSFSYDGGRTWTEREKIDAATGYINGHGGFIRDSHTGRLIYHGHSSEGIGFLPDDPDNSVMVTRFLYSDDNGQTWNQLTQLETDAYYILSYSDGVELSCYDGTGPNVDFVLPLGSLYHGGSMCARVAYSTDAGSTWKTSETKIIFGQEDADHAENGISEANILEMDDGTLVLVARCQGSDTQTFARSISTDHGISWQSPAEATEIYTVNTQPILYRHNGTDLLIWSGNNILGNSSYRRFPLNVATSDDQFQSVTNIQDLYVKYSLQGMTMATQNQATNPAVTTVGEDGLLITWTHHALRQIMVTRIDNFTDYFYRTKGAYDHFEHGSIKYEGWSAIKGSPVLSTEHAHGTYAMKLGAYAAAVRSVPYLQNGTVSIELYVPSAANASFSVELQATHSPEYGKASPLGILAENGVISFTGSEETTDLMLVDGWNTLTFALDLTNGTATVTLNDKTANIPVNTDIGDYVTYVYLMNNNASSVYVDDLLVMDTDAPITPKKEEPKPQLPRPSISLTLNESIDMNFYLKKADIGEDFTLVVKRNGEVLEEGRYTLTETADGRYRIRVSINADRMCDEITVQAFDLEGKAISQERTESVCTYVKLRLKNAGAPVEEKAALIRMLDYGTLAQMAVAGGEVENPANGVLTADERALLDGITFPEATAAADAAVGTKAGSKFSVSLTANETIDMNLYIAKTDMKDGYTIQVKRGGKVLTAGQYQLSETADGRIRVRVSVNADKMNDVIEVQVMKADGTAAYEARSLSVRHFVTMRLNNASASATEKAMMIALADYGTLVQMAAAAKSGTTVTDPTNRYITAEQRAQYDYKWN